ncbi:MAG: restriction endonuclease subunit S [Acidimicrobiia bacterium]|nr:restriction endonuclease subunit S [Acidimicrobiia bacterium]
MAEVNPPVHGWEAIPEDQPLTFLPLEAVWPRRMDYSRQRPKAKVASGYTRFCEGDVIVPKITPTFQADRSTLIRGMPTAVGTGTTELHVIRPSSAIDPRYLDYLMSSRPFLLGGEAWMIGVAGQKRVPDQWIRDFPIPVTDPAEQRAIADYLDTEASRIDTLITKKRRMIELLEERLRRMALGLLTGEGVAKRWSVGPYWLGSVPRTWMPHKVAWAKKTASGTTPESGSPVYYDSEGIPWITTSELREATIVDSEKRVTNAAFEDYSALKVFPVGTILVAMYGATVGRLGILGTPAATNQACCAVYGSGTLDQQFLYWWLWANRGPVVSMAYGSGQPNISQELIRGLRVPAPDVEEQRQIADRIEREAAGTERATARLSRLIELLAERRQALITTAVTGELAVSAGVA